MPAATPGFANLLGTKFQGVLFDVGPERALEYPLWCDSRDMLVNPEIYLQASGLGAMPQKPEGEQFRRDQPILGGQVNPSAVPYGMLFEVTFEMYDDDLYDIMASQWREMGRSARFRQEVVAAALLINAFNGSFPGYDGVALCSTAHPLLGGGTQANRGATDITFSVTGLQNMILRAEGRVNQRGLQRPVQLTRVLITPTNRFLIREVLGSSGQPQTANNDLNSMVPEALSWRVLHYLTSPNDYFAMADVSQTDLHFLWRNRPRANQFDDPYTENANFSLYQRIASYFGAYEAVEGSHPT
jgi:hypothetical protein